MVEAINPISATVASEPTNVGTSTSIGSEPDNAWVAARQSQITGDQLALRRDAQPPHTNALIPHLEQAVEDEEHERKRDGGEMPDGQAETGEQAKHPTLSGESERIGTRNFDDDTPFGDRVAIV
ncbi:hypothetical protein GA0061105_102501 [Rhizobium aethiopicum]|uniref:Uncharacterized protein n=1 Tax=Rhizobium aethiopicum TaxID=1138170 RepID=A0A1C3XZ46_9HYPH|nr:hypothetical protein [Rhizobium aethiopicum]SCB57508.1 hypothetical protein GA0061105_102501 [Rhizobium aethiopicum]